MAEEQYQQYILPEVQQEGLNPSDTTQIGLENYRGRINVGKGDYSIHIEKTQGIWIGSDTFSTAPFSVDMQGNVIAESITVNGSDLAFQNEFGDGSDGALTTSGNVTLTKDVFYTTLTVTAGDTFNPAGYRVFCSTSCTVNGTIERNGSTGGNGGNGSDGGGAGGSAGTAGTALAAGTIAGSAAGTAGVAGATAAGGGLAGTAGNAAAAETSIMSTGGRAGVAGGASGSSNAGGAAGAATTGTQTKTFPRTSSLATFMFDTANSNAQIKSHNATSGSGSGGAGSGTGNSGGAGGGSGGSGSNGGMIFIAAPTITVASTGTIRANGGAGGTGGNGGNGSIAPASGGGGGGGGSGGSGGTIVLMYKGSSYTNSGTVQCAGGSGGAGGTGGSPAGGGGTGSSGTTGLTGNSGTIITLSI